MSGYDALWQVGTDHAGIVTQMVVERELEKKGLTRESLGRKKFIEGIRGNNWYYMAFRSEDEGVSVWIDSYCTNYIRSPRRSFAKHQMSFGGDGFAGRFDDIKLYNKRLRPWEIKDNYWGKEYEIDLRDQLITIWSNIKYR